MLGRLCWCFIGLKMWEPGWYQFKIFFFHWTKLLLQWQHKPLNTDLYQDILCLSSPHPPIVLYQDILCLSSPHPPIVLYQDIHCLHHTHLLSFIRTYFACLHHTHLLSFIMTYFVFTTSTYCPLSGHLCLHHIHLLSFIRTSLSSPHIVF